MKHFAAEYVSPYPYYGARRSAVVIAKYYEGAKINGHVEFMGEPLQAETSIRKSTSLYGNSLMIDHDKTDTIDGNFSLIAPAGDITLEIRRYPEMGLNSFVMKSITFNSTSDPELAIITDDDAMRIKGSNFERILNITVDPAEFRGYVYQNKDDDDEYNISSDIPLSDVEMSLWEIDETDPETGQPVGYGSFNQMTTDGQGYYNVSGLKPGIYMIRAVLDDFVIHENYAFIYSGNNTYNISKPKPAAVDGIIYFDIYDNGEEMGDVNVDLLYTKPDGENKLVGTMTTDGTGSYSFSSLYPGQYVINATESNSATGYLDYSIEDPLTLKENENATHNVSISYATIALSGYTKEGTENIGDIEIDFSPDGSVESNTAEQVSVTSDEDGSYVAELKPGHYNISVDDESGEYGATYSYSGQITIAVGEGVKTLDLLMTKETITISGSTTHLGVNVGSIPIAFLADSEVENNTAKYASATSDENGDYIVELVPGSYEVTVDEQVNESGQYVTYTFTGSLEVKDTDVSIVFNIAMTREEQY